MSQKGNPSRQAEMLSHGLAALGVKVIYDKNSDCFIAVDSCDETIVGKSRETVLKWTRPGLVMANVVDRHLKGNV